MSELGKRLLDRTSFFGIRLWILIISSLATFLVVAVAVPALCFLYRRWRKLAGGNCCLPFYATGPKRSQDSYSRISSLDKRLLTGNLSERLSGQWSAPASGTFGRYTVFGFRDMEMITNEFANENLIGREARWLAYRGFLLENVPVAVKKLLPLDGEFEAEDFVARAETICNIRHRNVVKQLGYCVEGPHRMVVQELVGNGNLHEWLHGPTGEARPLTWKIRMKIIQGIAKGLAYLHEDVEPRSIHGDLKSSNILLDHQWNPKISDAGLRKLLRPNHSNAQTNSMVMSGYFSQECASPCILSEKSDVYSFGTLIMEIVSGRMPVDSDGSQGFLVDWIKSMVVNRKIMQVLDPKMPETPPSKELKRIILIALRCVDPDISHRPKMGDVILMLEPRDLLLNDARPVRKERSRCHGSQEKNSKVSDLGEPGVDRHKRKYNFNQYQKITK